MTDESPLYRELISQFSEVLDPGKGGEFSGTIGAIRLRHIHDMEKECGILKRSSLKCTILGKEVEEALDLEKKILEMANIVIGQRKKSGSTLEFEKQGMRFAQSEIYPLIRKLYAIRYSEQEALKFDAVFLWKEEDGSTFIIEYKRRPNTKETDMSSSSFYIKRLRIKYPSSPEGSIPSKTQGNFA